MSAAIGVAIVGLYFLVWWFLSLYKRYKATIVYNNLTDRTCATCKHRGRGYVDSGRCNRPVKATPNERAVYGITHKPLGVWLSNERTWEYDPMLFLRRVSKEGTQPCGIEGTHWEQDDEQHTPTTGG